MQNSCTYVLKMSEIQLKNEIESLLKIVASKENVTNYEPIFNVKEALRGDGFLGEFFLAGIKNKTTGTIIELAIKKAVKDESKRKEFSIITAYINEVYIFLFKEIPRFYYGTLEEFKEALVMENLKIQGYSMRDKRELLDEGHVKLVLKTFGKFHALSFALKDRNTEEYKKLINGLQKSIMEQISKNNSFKRLLKGIMEDAYEALDMKEDADVRKKLEKFRDSPDEEFRKAINLHCDHKVIAHGDCWSNNMMFRYTESGKVENMKLIDFQLINEASPVHDLAYFFYSGASKEQYDNFNDCLKVYHNSLSKNLCELGSNPEKLYPFEQLQKDWSKHGRFGLLFSFIPTKIKIIDDNVIQDMVKDNANDDVLNKMSYATVNKDIFNKRIRNILLHASKYDVI